MTMIIVDSSVWIDALRGKINPHSVWLKAALGQEPVGLTSLILCEVLQGIRNETQFRGVQRALLELPVFDTFSSQLAVTAAQHYRTLRNRGVTVRKTVDCIIATFCMENEYRLLHSDRDFDAFESHLGLLVLHPPAIS
jgi:predicted nucleic acid-binding protein